ncbi:esterase/lipase family protein [Rubricoccus marinus]|uniref:esterase/lipase family protein n=1 Tax=Rubricoccus marinus TaxID=716817 RepID=UPI00117B12D1|nr:alpha/beta fold hydrolase [Rubricoccus marinus]
MPSRLARSRTRLAKGAEAVARRAVELVPAPQPPLTPTRYPVVLLHGFGALANVLQGGVLHREAMYLRARGIHAYAPHANPYDTVAVRSATWAEHLERAMEETGADKLNLIGFSSGGLDARWLAREMGWADRIASVVTVSTPHRGTALAQFVLDRPERLRSWAVAFMDFVGRAAYELEPPDSFGALRELTPETVADLFPPEETIPGAWCASIVGRAGKGTDVSITPSLALTNRILYAAQGVNDGIVPTDGAWWGERLETLDADHARQIGIGLSIGSSFDSRAFFLSICERLRERGL